MMIIKRWVGNDVDCIPGLRQEYEHLGPQDWIVSKISHDTDNRMYWVEGINTNDGLPFYWGLYTDRPLDRRFDLTNATYHVGRHETEAEARRRERLQTS